VTRVLALVGAQLLLTAQAHAWCQMTTSRDEPTSAVPCVTTGTPLAWQRRCLSYSVDARASSSLDLETVRAVVAESFQTWLDAPCDAPVPFEVREEAPATCLRAEYSRDDGNINHVSFLPEWPSRYEDTAYAITTVWHSRDTGEILDADIELNEAQGPFAVCPAAGCPSLEDGTRAVDLRNVVTHELGHFFGIAHSQFAGSTMDAVSVRGETSKRILRTDDVTGFCAMYPPDALPSECDFTPRGGLDPNCEDDPKGCSAPGNGDLAPLLLALLLVSRRRSTPR